MIRWGTDARKRSLVILTSKTQQRRAGRGAERAWGDQAPLGWDAEHRPVALCSPELLPPQAEVIKDVKELFITGGGVWLDAWLCSKGNKITSSLPAPRAAAVPSAGGCSSDIAGGGVLEAPGSP